MRLGFIRFDRLGAGRWWRLLASASLASSFAAAFTSQASLVGRWPAPQLAHLISASPCFGHSQVGCPFAQWPHWHNFERPSRQKRVVWCTWCCQSVPCVIAWFATTGSPAEVSAPSLGPPLTPASAASSSCQYRARLLPTSAFLRTRSAVNRHLYITGGENIRRYKVTTAAKRSTRLSPRDRFACPVGLLDDLPWCTTTEGLAGIAIVTVRTVMLKKRKITARDLRPVYLELQF
ncbi:hypothetical protein Pdw03_0560 [Penicillium digitatum]|uniref:Uncharacterized protein n=1 Tax=Penicillium digitatum TaxID=36651 RepID=A0A7T6XRC7_PENDI|nr:hypothetical protein Pdw03_0560 [Penicillium digitatum]